MFCSAAVNVTILLSSILFNKPLRRALVTAGVIISILRAILTRRLFKIFKKDLERFYFRLKNLLIRIEKQVKKERQISIKLLIIIKQTPKAVKESLRRAQKHLIGAMTIKFLRKWVATIIILWCV